MNKNTIYIQLDESKNEFNSYLEKAAQILNMGGLVAFPTETVYGLGGNALDPMAAKKIYEAKGRPSDNPLIVHISKIEDLNPLVKEIPDNAKLLMSKFWPGPLTLIFQKSELVPYETTGGLDTVAVRFPENQIAQKLISLSEVPIAAPSANTSGKPSPTKGIHVKEDLFGKIDMILDGGNCDIGLESTVVDVTGEVPMLFRPGGITIEAIREIIPEAQIDPAVLRRGGLNSNVAPKAPGMKYKHYAPDAEVLIVKLEKEKGIPLKDYLNKLSNSICNLVKGDLSKRKRIGIIATHQTAKVYINKLRLQYLHDRHDIICFTSRNKSVIMLVVGNRLDEKTIASNLFHVLRTFNHEKIDRIYCENMDDRSLGMAITNRILKAAGYNIVNIK